MMDIAQIRLEALKLAHRHDHLPEMVIDRAKAYEAFVTGTAQAGEVDNLPIGPQGRRGRPPSVKPA